MAPVTWLTSAEGKLLSRKLDPGNGLGMSLTAATGIGRLKLTPPSCETATRISEWWKIAPSQNTYTVPSGPVRITEPCRPPTALLFALWLSRMPLLHVAPQSVD